MVTMEADPPSSLLVVSRSGTGKTTVAIQHMVLKEEQYGLDINQVFVTMNPVLLALVKRNYRAKRRTRGAQGGGGARTLPVSLQAAT